MRLIMQPDLTISIISADNLDLLLPCLRSIIENTHHLSLEIYIVDNASTDSTTPTIQAQFPQVKLIRNQARLGFATNNNKVLRRGQGRYLMLLNDDTLVLDGALDTLVEFADLHPDVGIISSFLLNPDCTFQASCSAFPNPWIEGFWSTAAVFPRLHYHAVEPFETDTVCGAVLMIRRETMQQVGLLDTQFDPIYAEETDWCYRVKQSGWKVYSHPQAKIIHYGGQTMNRIPARKLELLQSHKILFFQKHYNPFAVNFFKTTLWLASLIKSIIHFRPWSKVHIQKAKLHWFIFKRVPRL